jgi:hypothetical protein
MDIANQDTAPSPLDVEASFVGRSGHDDLLIDIDVWLTTSDGVRHAGTALIEPNEGDTPAALVDCTLADISDHMRRRIVCAGIKDMCVGPR